MPAQRSSSSTLFGVLALLILGGLIIYGVQALAGGGTVGSGPAPSASRVSLSEAVMRDDAAAVKAAIKSGADCNATIVTDKPGREGMTALIHASYEGKADTVKALLEAKPKIEARTEDGRTALMFAAGWADAAKVKLLLDAGARTDARASDGWTALMWAAARGEPASLKALVQAGADVNAANKWRQTALMAAGRAGSAEKVAMLLEAGASAAATDMNGDSALSISAAGDTPVVVLETLAKAGAPVNGVDSEGVTPLMKAAERGDAEAVASLMKLGADPKVKDKVNGWTAREWATKRDDDKGRAVVKALEGAK
jgi:ankyrin repeat protein